MQNTSLIGRNITVETIIANEPPIDDTRQRYLRFDVACKTEKGELDWRSGMADVENKGRNEEILENARKMKSMGFLTEQIQAVTDLSPDVITQLWKYNK